MKYWTLISIALTAAIAILAWRYQWIVTDDNTLRTAAGIIAQTSATMLGFLLAVVSVLASIAGTRLVKNMMKTGHYRVLLRKLMLNALAYGLAAAISFPAIFISDFVIQVIAISLFSFTVACLWLIDVGWRMWLVMTNLDAG